MSNAPPRLRCCYCERDANEIVDEGRYLNRVNKPGDMPAIWKCEPPCPAASPGLTGTAGEPSVEDVWRDGFRFGRAGNGWNMAWEDEAWRASGFSRGGAAPADGPTPEQFADGTMYMVEARLPGWGAAPASPAVRTPKNAQHEPPYPGAETVVTSIRYPEQVIHRATARCANEAPHLWADCGEVPPASPPVREATELRLALRWALSKIGQPTRRVAGPLGNAEHFDAYQRAAALAAEGERP